MNVRKYMKQALVYWKKTGTGSNGQPLFDNPVPLSCRWDDVQEELQFADGRKVISQAHLIVPQLLVLGSVVMLGTMNTWKLLPTYPRLPTKAQGGCEVFRASHTPDIHGKSLLYEAYL